MNTKVLDTNIILEHSLQCIIDTLNQEPIKVVIPFKVLMELDTFKKGLDTINYNARRSLGFLEELRKTSVSKLCDGVVYNNCIIQVFFSEEDKKIDPNKVDNSMILVAKELKELYCEEEVSIITEDLHPRLVADIFGIEAKTFESEITEDDLYTGVINLQITDEQVDEFYSKGYFEPEEEVCHNQFAIMEDAVGGIHYGIFKAGKIIKLNDFYNAWNIKPKKHADGSPIIEQSMFMHLLMDPKVEFITATGPSGCGKTLLTLACALEQTLKQHKYDKIVVMRPMTSIDRDLGALPGNKLEKIEPWMASTFDNLEYLFDNYTHDNSFVLSPRDKIYELMEVGKLELEAMQFIRGRSIPGQFIIVDDCQNLTPHQAATIITRAGEGSKVVFLGDINKQQIDNHRLNSNNNGLTYVVQRFKGADKIIGHITLETVVRSRLASIGVELL